MTDKEFRRLRKRELLQLLVRQGREAVGIQESLAKRTGELEAERDCTERLKRKLDEKDAQIERLKERLGGKDAQLERLKEKLDEKDAQIEHLKRRLDQKDLKIEALERQLNGAKGKERKDNKSHARADGGRAHTSQ